MTTMMRPWDVSSSLLIYVELQSRLLGYNLVRFLTVYLTKYLLRRPRGLDGE